MTEIIIDTGLKSKIHQVQWEEVCGSVSSTQDIQDYGDYAIIDDFIEKIDELTEAVSRYPSDSRSMECEAAHKEFGELEKGYKFPGIEQLLPSTYFNPIIFACYKAFVECEFIPHDLDSNTTEEGKIRFMQKLPNISVVKGTLLHPGMIINKNSEVPGLGNFDFQATLFLTEPPEGSGIGLYDVVIGETRCSGIEDLMDLDDDDERNAFGKWLSENAVCKAETTEYTNFKENDVFQQTRFIEARKNRLVLHKGTNFQRYEYEGTGDMYMLSIYMNQPPKNKELAGNEIEQDDNY